MRRLVASALLAVSLVACGGGSGVSYVPAAWGPHGYCYYLYSPYECYGHHYGQPVLMPLYWHQRYAAYYDSPAYVQSYVPSRYRSTATAGARTFEQKYSSAIRTASRNATWHGSDGKTVSGTKVGRSATYGSGGARSTGFSGGSMRKSSAGGNPCAALHRYYVAATVFVRGSTGSSGGSSGGGARASGVGGGSARSGGSVGTKAGSRSGRNC